jgi:lactoylglutathione lyase
MSIPTRALFEAHLTVSDLDRSLDFYREVVGLPLAYEVRDRGAAFLWIGPPGRSMLGLWSLGSAPMGLRLHVAFDVGVDDLLRSPEALSASGVTPLSFFGEPTDEPSVIGWMPSASVYFLDPDGHLLEYLSMLDEPPRPEAGIVSWAAWLAAS